MNDFTNIRYETVEEARSQPEPAWVRVKPSEWHRVGEECILLYTLKQDGWRRGEPVMVNDITIRIENANGSSHDLSPIADAVLSALTEQQGEAQCCVCGKKGLSTVEGDGGTECQLEDGRWTCSEPCWEKAGGYGPDLSPAEGETSDGSEQAAIEIADAVIAWMVRHDLLDADQEYRDDNIIAVLDELSPGLATTNDEAFASPLAAPSNPVISDEMVLKACRSMYPTWDVAMTPGDHEWYSKYMRAALTAALSVQPQSGSDKP